MKANHPLGRALKGSMIQTVPSYGNRFLYSLGFLSAISFVMLLVTGLIMTFYGPTWWLTSGVGSYVRSIHMWATQAFVLFILLHLLIVFFTSGFKKPRRLTWVLGVLMLFLVLAETEFGYVLRGDFSSQWRSLQGADFYNGAGLGWWLNPLNYKQLFGIHIVVVPLVILGLLGLHYLLVRVLGIAKPYRSDVTVATVPANHKLLFARGGGVIVLVMALAALLPSPQLQPVSIQSVAQQDPYLVSKTLLAEYTHTSDTATYSDNIAPYTFDTRDVFINQPYRQLTQTDGTLINALDEYNSEPANSQKAQLDAASKYYGEDKPTGGMPSSPLIDVISKLTLMASSGLYESALATPQYANPTTDSSTSVLRFLADTGALEEKAGALNITTEQYGMVREESGHAPGAWWLSPIGVLNHTVLSGDDNGDRDAAIIFGSLLLTMLAFPFIPYVNQIPDKLKVYKLIWHTKK